MRADFSDAEIDRLATTALRSEVEHAVALLVSKKGAIEAQLRLARTDMLLYRKQLIEAGYTPEDAQLEAEAFSRPDWRGRAIGACRRVDGVLARLRRRISALSGTPKVLSARVLKALSATEAAEQFRELVTTGEIDYFHAAVPYPDGLLLIYRRGDPS